MTPCDAFDRWLDDGHIPAGRGAALAHARACARCAAALAAADVLGALPVTPAPARFTERVMARVAVTAQQRPHVLAIELMPLPPALPWWVRASFEPASVLALLVAAALLWRGPILFALAGSAASQMPTWLAAAGRLAPTTSLDTLLLHPAALAAIAIGLAAPVFMVSQALYRWSSGLVAPPHARPRMR